MRIPSLGNPGSAQFLTNVKEALEVLSGRRGNAEVDLGAVAGKTLKPYSLECLASMVNGWSNGIYYVDAYPSFAGCIDELKAQGKQGSMLIVSTEQVITASIDASDFGAVVVGNGAFVGVPSVAFSIATLWAVSNQIFKGFDTGAVTINYWCSWIAPFPRVAGISSDTTFTVLDGPVHIITPGSGGLKYDPYGSFFAGYEARVVNGSGANSLVFDSTGLNYTIAAGKTRTFIKGASAWSLEDFS